MRAQALDCPCRQARMHRDHQAADRRAAPDRPQIHLLDRRQLRAEERWHNAADRFPGGNGVQTGDLGLVVAEVQVDARLHPLIQHRQAKQVRYPGKMGRQRDRLPAERREARDRLGAPADDHRAELLVEPRGCPVGLAVVRIDVEERVHQDDVVAADVDLIGELLERLLGPELDVDAQLA